MDLKKSNHTKEKWEKFLKGEVTLVIPADTEIIVVPDAGKEMTGYIIAAFSGGKDAEVSLLYAEAYLQGYEDIYHVSGIGTEAEQEIYETYRFRTFRFVRLHIRTEKETLRLHGFDYEETGYPLQVVSSVRTSDPSLEQIWEISARTLRRCMHETYEDCPFYEQLQYIMDARTQILFTYAVSADDRLARKCMDDLRCSQRYDGLLNCSYPNCKTNALIQTVTGRHGGI